MAVRIVLDRQPEFYTNLDHISGRVILNLHRAEQIASIVVKLEGEAVTALQVPSPYGDLPTTTMAPGRTLPGPPGSVVSETHRILYKVQQVFPDDYHSSTSSSYGAFPLQPGEHAFPFHFKLPINNACSDPIAMSRLGGLGGLGGFGSGGGGLFGLGGVRVMDGSKQLYLEHVTRTLPPSLTGFQMEAEIRYFLKATIQRPGILKENWRLQLGFKFLPIEPSRQPATGQEAFARRPFTFWSKPQLLPERTRSSFFGRKQDKGSEKNSPISNGETSSSSPSPAPSIEMSARLLHPPILTCNQPVPLRLVSKKLNNSTARIYLASLQIDLIGITDTRSHGIISRKLNRWVVLSNSGLSIPVTLPQQEQSGTEIILPDALWMSRPLPNTVSPSFTTCNLSRRYELELKLGLAWGNPRAGSTGKNATAQPQTIFLPLHFSQVDVYSGIPPPPALLAATSNPRPGRTAVNRPTRLPSQTSAATSNSATLPAQSQNASAAPTTPQRPPSDPLYPPQLAPGQQATAYDDAPPSYDEAMAEDLAGPFDGLRPRPAYSGVTNENAPRQIPEKPR